MASLGIGAKLLDEEAALERRFTGFWDEKIDELSIFNQALTSETIQQLYSAVGTGISYAF